MVRQNKGSFNFLHELNIQKSLDKPFLDIAACFWEKERRDAAKICYHSMRIIDDLVDNSRNSIQEITAVERQRLTDEIKGLIEVINGAKSCDSDQRELVETISRFQIPIWPWKSFAKSMIYDLQNNGFKTFESFLRYAEGATVAPASIAMHLCGILKEDGNYSPPLFDVRTAARDGAIFCYLVHIIRDFQKDQNNNKNFYANDIMTRFGLTKQILRKIAQGGKIDHNFRNLMKTYYDYANYYQRKTRIMMDRIKVYLQPRYWLSFEVIYNLYSLIFDRIDISSGSFTTAELIPSPEEVNERIDQTISIIDSKF